MTQAELFALMERFEQSGIAEMSFRQGDDEVSLRKAATLVAAAPIAMPAAAAAAEKAPVEPVGTFIRAPLVGTFYAAPSPGATPFAPIGKAIKKGDTIGIIEAMKMISELPSPCDCVVAAVLAESGALVSYNQPLLRVLEN